MNITDSDRKQLRLPDTIWVQYGEVTISHQGDEILVKGNNQDAYLKVLNHFGRVLKLYTHENGEWEDADTGGAPTGFDMTLAGRLPAPPHIEPDAAKKPAAQKPPAKKPAAKKPPAKKATTRKVVAKKPGKPAAKGGAKTGGKSQVKGAAAPTAKKGTAGAASQGKTARKATAGKSAPKTPAAKKAGR